MMVTFFRDLEQWRDRETVAKFSCPRMTVAGSDDAIVSRGAPAIRIGPLIAEHRADLEEMGWTVRLVSAQSRIVGREAESSRSNPLSQQQSQATARHGAQKAFGEDLTHQPQSPRSERKPEAELTLTAECSRKKKAG
jgi:hypothetical protein